MGLFIYGQMGIQCYHLYPNTFVEIGTVHDLGTASGGDLSSGGGGGGAELKAHNQQ